MPDSVAPRFAEHFQRLEAFVSAEVSPSRACQEAYRNVLLGVNRKTSIIGSEKACSHSR